MKDLNNIIETRLLKGRIPDFHNKRAQRISEAIAFNLGTREKPVETIISILDNEKKVCFHKPGKEFFRNSNPNIHDMYPGIWSNGINEVEGWAFEKLWEYLIKISIINQVVFKKVLVIIYRNCYLLDHIEKEEGKWRYEPSSDLYEYIEKIEFGLKDGFLDKFNSKEIGLFEFLHFVDILGWNEDVKYNTSNLEPLIGRNKKTGRVNTILSIISAPIMISKFILDIIHKTEIKGIIDVKLITSTIQTFSKTRGICTLNNDELVKYLNPYLID
jgi:hypothetical protein